MTIHKVTGVTPNQAMFGREALLPATLIASPPEEPVNPTVPFVRDLRNHIRSAHQQVRNATQAVAKTQKTYYDHQVKGPPFAVGQLVWLYWPCPPLRPKFRKLQQVWTGPCKIVSFQTDVVVHLQHMQKHSKQTVHINRLSPCKVAVENSSFGTPPKVAEDRNPVPAPANSTQNATATEHQSSPLSPTTPSPSSAPDRPRRARRPPVALEPYVVG